MNALDPITGADFQRLAGIRLGEATTLRGSGQYEGAYYLTGYAVECALKACICARQQPGHFPPKEKVARDLYSHNLSTLLDLAGLKTAMDTAADATLKAYWNVAKDWSEQSRYNLPERQNAEQLYAAVADPRHGVLQWLRNYW